MRLGGLYGVWRALPARAASARENDPVEGGGYEDQASDARDGEEAALYEIGFEWKHTSASVRVGRGRLFGRTHHRLSHGPRGDGRSMRRNRGQCEIFVPERKPFPGWSYSLMTAFAFD